MKKLIAIVGAIIMATAVKAQINVGANFLIGVPSGEWNDPAFVSTGLGGGIEGNYFVIEDQLSVGLEVGFLSFSEKEEGFPISMTATPIIIKGEYYFLDDAFRPFVGLGIGYYLVNMKVTTPAIPGFVEEMTTTTAANGMGISPRIGASYQATDLIAVVLNFNYNLLFGQKADGEALDNATNWIGIGIGARFTIQD